VSVFTAARAGRID